MPRAHTLQLEDCATKLDKSPFGSQTSGGWHLLLGYLHAGVLTTVADSACGYSAYTLMPAGADVLSVEFKMNLLRPARAERFVAEARVVKAGATLTVARCDVYGWAADQSKMVVTMLATLIRK